MYGEVKKGSREFSLARTSKDNPLMCIRVDTGCVSCKAKIDKGSVHFMCHKCILKSQEHGTNMVRLDKMSKRDRGENVIMFVFGHNV